VALAGWLGAPAVHVATVERPLGHIEGSLGALLLAGGALGGSLLLAWPIPSDGAGPHRVGQGALIALAATATATAALAWALPGFLPLQLALRWASFPLALALIGLGFAFVGRVHRRLGHRKLANLADLVGLTAPLLWCGAQLFPGYPGPALWAPGLAAMALGAAAIATLPLPPRSSP
jgi:hypothetical protein